MGGIKTCAIKAESKISQNELNQSSAHRAIMAALSNSKKTSSVLRKSKACVLKSHPVFGLLKTVHRACAKCEVHMTGLF